MSEPIYRASRHDRPHARIYDHHCMHPAWRALSGNAFKLLTCLLAKYRPTQPNSFLVGGKRAAEMIDVSEKTATKLVDELVDAGHLREERKGSNKGVLRTRERVVSLTRYDTELYVGDPELPIKVWRTRKKSREGPVKKSGSKNFPIEPIASDNSATIIPLKTPNTHM